MNKRFLAVLMAVCFLLTPVGTNAAEDHDPVEVGANPIAFDEKNLEGEDMLAGNVLSLAEEIETTENQEELDLSQAVSDLADPAEASADASSSDPDASTAVETGTEILMGVDAQGEPEPVSGEDDMLTNLDAGAMDIPENAENQEQREETEQEDESHDDVPAQGELEDETGKEELSGGNSQAEEGVQEPAQPLEGQTLPLEGQAQPVQLLDDPSEGKEPQQGAPDQGERISDNPVEGTDSKDESTEAREETAEAAEEAEGENSGASDAAGEAEESADGEEPELAEANSVPKIKLSATVLTLGKKESLRLYAADEDPEGGWLRWMIANSRIATINQAGVVKAKKVGVTVARVINSKGVYADCTIVVKKAPKGIKASPTTIYVSVGDRVHINAWPKSGACSTYKYSSKKKKIAQVNSSGWVYGVRPGKTTVTVKSYNRKRARVKVVVVAPPSRVSVSPANRMLGIGQTFKLNTAIPKNTSTTFTFFSSDETVAAVNGSGIVTAVGLGTAVITACTHNGKAASCEVTVKEAPTGIDVDLTDYECAVGDVRQANAVLSPSGSYADIQWSSGNERVATVTQSGKVTAVGKGETTITAKTYLPGVSYSFHLKVFGAPESVSAGKSSVDILIDLNSTADLTATIPQYTRTTFTFASSAPDVVTVESLDPSNTGALKEREAFRLKALKRGRATVTVTTANGKKAQIAVRVMDSRIPESIELANPVPTLNAGDKHKLSLTIVPSTATGTARLTFTSNNASIATVSADGTIKGVAMGETSIIVAFDAFPEVRLSIPVSVYSSKLVTVLPSSTTKLSAGKSAIQNNLLKIQALEKSAHWMVDSLRTSGTISAADAKKRNAIITEAFKDYSFPWVTPAYQAYWKKANSENGAKDFKTGIVYYGMPYTSGSSTNRAYNVAKALSEKRWTNSGKGYYKLNRNKLLNGSYVGNDCSAFVTAAIWGVDGIRKGDRTKDIAEISAYKTIKNYTSMRPGDLICKSGSHVVMFLYFANAAKTKVMVIENGGPWAGTNTIHCAIYDLSWFTARGYKVRRLSTLG